MIPEEDVLAELVASDEESLHSNDYGNSGDFESEFSDSETEEQPDVCQDNYNNNNSKANVNVDVTNHRGTLAGTTSTVSSQSVDAFATTSTTISGRPTQDNNYRCTAWSRDTTNFVEQSFFTKIAQSY